MKAIKYFFIRLKNQSNLVTFSKEEMDTNPKIKKLTLGKHIISNYRLRYKYVGNGKFLKL